MNGRILMLGVIALFALLALAAVPVFAAGTTVSGTVTDINGTPLAGADVWLVDNSYVEFAMTISDENGNFEFAGVSGVALFKAYAAYPRSGDTRRSPASETWYSAAEPLVKIDLNDTRIPAAAEQPALPGSYVKVLGTVTDRNDRPVPGATVTLYNDVYRAIGETTTDSAGLFFFNVSGDRLHTIKVRVSYASGAHVYRTELQNTMWYAADMPVVNIDRQDTRLTEYPQSSTGFVWGMITDESGDRALNGTVFLANATGRTAFHVTGVGVAPGFIIEAAPGNYTLIAEHDTGAGVQVSDSYAISVKPASNYLDEGPIVLKVANRATGTGISPGALLLALVLGLAAVATGTFLLRKL